MHCNKLSILCHGVVEYFSSLRSVFNPDRHVAGNMVSLNACLLDAGLGWDWGTKRLQQTCPAFVLQLQCKTPKWIWRCPFAFYVILSPIRLFSMRGVPEKIIPIYMSWNCVPRHIKPPESVGQAELVPYGST